MSYYHNIGEERFNENIETNIFRLVQESITNIVKYAEAKHVNISLFKREDLLYLKIRDDGRGFDTNNFKTKEGHGNGHLNI